MLGLPPPSILVGRSISPNRGEGASGVRPGMAQGVVFAACRAIFSSLRVVFTIKKEASCC